MNVSFAMNLFVGFFLELVYLILVLLYFGKILNGEFRRLPSDIKVYREMSAKTYTRIISGSIVLFVLMLPSCFILLFHIPGWGILLGLGGVVVYLGVGYLVAGIFHLGLDGLAASEKRYPRGWGKWANEAAFVLFLLFIQAYRLTLFLTAIRPFRDTKKSR